LVKQATPLRRNCVSRSQTNIRAIARNLWADEDSRVAAGACVQRLRAAQKRAAKPSKPARWRYAARRSANDNSMTTTPSAAHDAAMELDTNENARTLVDV